MLVRDENIFKNSPQFLKSPKVFYVVVQRKLLHLLVPMFYNESKWLEEIWWVTKETFTWNYFEIWSSVSEILGFFIAIHEKQQFLERLIKLFNCSGF